jgi:hypothetical protein
MMFCGSCNVLSRGLWDYVIRALSRRMQNTKAMPTSGEYRPESNDLIDPDNTGSRQKSIQSPGDQVNQYQCL